ncbi:MAG TPA: hypothetical protein VFU49_16505 [Ktedonobacteraceae bacterium]|nr:hypothetical protein [Ktedonobacteraceae bacterium]
MMRLCGDAVHGAEADAVLEQAGDKLDVMNAVAIESRPHKSFVATKGSTSVSNR